MLAQAITMHRFSIFNKCYTFSVDHLPESLTVKEVRYHLMFVFNYKINFSTNTIYHWVRIGRLYGTKTNGKINISKDSYIDFLKGCLRVK
jgi:hypothetical protein